MICMVVKVINVVMMLWDSGWLIVWCYVVILLFSIRKMSTSVVNSLSSVVELFLLMMSCLMILNGMVLSVVIEKLSRSVF